MRRRRHRSRDSKEEGWRGADSVLWCDATLRLGLQSGKSRVCSARPDRTDQMYFILQALHEMSFEWPICKRPGSDRVRQLPTCFLVPVLCWRPQLTLLVTRDSSPMERWHAFEDPHVSRNSDSRSIPSVFQDLTQVHDPRGLASAEHQEQAAGLVAADRMISALSCKCVPHQSRRPSHDRRPKLAVGGHATRDASVYF